MSSPADAELDAWDFDLPPDRIARHPHAERAGSRLLVLGRPGEAHTHSLVRELGSFLRPGDVLVANDSRVVPARLRTQRETGGKVELFVVRFDGDRALVLARPARKLRGGATLTFGREQVHVVDVGGDEFEARFPRDVASFLEDHGLVPLPPYLGRDATAEDRTRYQTVYAGRPGSVAAPTAGLHFDAPLLAELAAAGIAFATVTLHVGLGTFRPLRGADLEAGRLHAERYDVPASTARTIASARAAGGRVIAVGTTAARTLVSATPTGASSPTVGPGETTLFLRPPNVPTAFDGLLTNFHLPRSSLLMLVATLVPKAHLFATYAEAIDRGYQFFSYGDAMLIRPEIRS